ncbi:unnamed protein product [Linum tenue]|uniref:Peptidase A1 domain-containing protein n=1 Tax=Linum tenue TaxID=586396 RepID=A0AAV0LWW4_9ROSI|nr:unnamed protein product [Linum tenue]
MANTTTLFALLCFLLLLLLSKTANGDAHILETNTTNRNATRPRPPWPPGIHFHTVQLPSLFPSNTCRPSPSISKDGLESKGAILPVLHLHGPCAQAQQQQQQHKPTADETLRQDESRVKTIQSRYRNAVAGADDVSVMKDSSTTIPAKDGATLGGANYFVTVGVGTPAQQQSLIFDTGSDLTWTQCQPCVRSCYKQQEKIFDPSSSASYRNVSCSSASCSALASATSMFHSIIGILINQVRIKPGCSSSTCVYGIQYGDSSYSVGFYGTEKITLTTSTGGVFNNFFFGCGQNNQGLFRGTAGLLGLGRDKVSFVSQTARKYRKRFSYCLPSTSSDTGFLTFGGGASTTKSVKYTPLSASSAGTSFYGLDITAISVGGQKLPISATVFSTAGGVIDSGAVISRLPPAAYSALRSAFRQQMSSYPLGKPRSILDTCYDFSSYDVVSVPGISFFFAGGVEVEIGAVGILYGFSISQVCLAFKGNDDASEVAVFGNVQQRTMEVVYDGARGRVGFAGGGCN